MGDPEKVADAVAFSRRNFVKKLVAAGFAIPVVSSFALNASSAGSTPKPAGFTESNLFCANQTVVNPEFHLNCDVPHGHEYGFFGGL